MITIHEKTAQSFNTLGLGALLPGSCIVTEEINGAYELKLSHPYDEGSKWKRIERGRILYASTPRGMQPFRIYNTKPNMSGIEVNARHIFYDLLDNQCSEISFNGTASEALAALQGAFAFAMPFSFDTNISVSGTMKTGRMNPVQALLSDDDETTSFVKGFGGELLRDGFNVSLLSAMGQDRDVAIRYGKNLVGLDVTEDEADVKTRIQYHGSDGSGTLDSPFISEYVYPKIYTLEDENKTKAELKAEAQALFDGGADLPLVNIKVDFITLADTVEYADYAPLEEVFLGDIVTIINQKMNFAKKARVISYEWDCLLERYNEVELGDFMPTLASSVTSGVRSGSLASAAAVGTSAVSAALQAHLNDFNNPHKTPTGGGSGTGDADAVLELLVEHEEDKDNPHSVTAAQVGAYTISEVDEKLKNVSGGGVGISYGTEVPDNADGNDGDLYLQLANSTGQDGNTLLLLHGENIIDSSVSERGIVNYGVAASAEQCKFDGKSLYFDGRAYLLVDPIDFGDGDFTIDWWEYVTDASSKARFASSFTTGGNFGGMLLGYDGASVYIDTTPDAAGSYDFDIVNDADMLSNTVNEWVHWAFVRSGNTLKSYRNGTMFSTVSMNGAIGFGSQYKMAIGAWRANDLCCFIGYIDEFRISNVARWNTDFTPPTKAYTNKGYVEVEYIESDGNGGYFNTRFVPNQNTRVIADVQMTNISNVDASVFGARTNTNVNSVNVIVTTAGRLVVDYGTERQWWTDEPQLSRFTIDYNKNVTTAMNETHTFTTQTFTSPVSMYLFARNNNGTVQSCGCMKLYSSEIYDNDIHARDYITVKDDIGTPCLYDKVSEAYLYPSGEGVFTAGPEVSSGMGILWLKQNGTWTQVLKGAA